MSFTGRKKVMVTKQEKERDDKKKKNDDKPPVDPMNKKIEKIAGVGARLDPTAFLGTSRFGLYGHTLTSFHFI